MRSATGDRVLAALLAVAALGFSGWYSWAAPCGSWPNRIFGTVRGGEIDPGAFYVFQAFELDDGLRPIFHGHPGTPLLLLLDGLQRAYYAAAAPASFDRARFVAQRLPEVFWLSKMAMTIVQLASCWALFRVALAILGDRRAALYAAIGYGTTFPVLCHLSMIFPEPLAVAFFGAAFLAYWRYEALAGAGRLAPAIAFAALAGVLAVSSAVTKLMVFGPLPPFLVAMALLDAPRRSASAPLAWRARLPGAAALAAASAATLALYGRFVDWQFFFWFWRNVPSLERGPRGVSFGDFAPGLSAWNLLPTAEVGYVAVAIAGCTLAWRGGAVVRPRAIAFAAYGALGLVVFVYRVSLVGSFLPIHYAYLPLYAAAPFFGLALAWFERRFVAARTASGAGAFALGAVVLLHGVGLVAAVESRQRDAAVFAPNRAAYRLIASLDPDERLLVEARGARGGRIDPDALSDRIAKLHGWPARGLPGIGGPPPQLRRAFDSMFTARAPRRAARDGERVPAPFAGVDLVRLAR